MDIEKKDIVLTSGEVALAKATIGDWDARLALALQAMAGRDMLESGNSLGLSPSEES